MSFRHNKDLPEGDTRIGHFFALPFEGKKIENVSRFLSFFTFNMNDRTVELQLNSDYFILVHGEQYQVHGLDFDFKDFLEFSIKDKLVTKARSDQYGTLEIHIEGDIVIIVDDDPFETWHYSDKEKRIYIHGGCGRFIC